MSKQANIFSCLNCGHEYTVYPPDSSFKYAYISPCQESSSIPNHNLKTGNECENCHQINKLYWCQGHFRVITQNKPSPDEMMPPSFRNRTFE
ncbi:MAG TPA: hypothetical protein VJ767_04295 [Nitrososphaeraceae archaeon]|nr:hypothetical protein [Nitrososphaeraceae archaeon]